MSVRHLLATGLAATGLLALAPAARAADLDYGYGDAPPPPVAEEKVEFGSGWYIRGDIGATKNLGALSFYDPSRNLFFSGVERTNNIGYDLSLGGGYSFTSAIRGDIVADFHQPAATLDNQAFCYQSVSQTCVSTGHFNSYDALINGYYDFGKWGIVSPYVGAGVGVAFGNSKSNLLGGSSQYVGSFSYHQLAWALMAGISLDVFDHTKLDIGYRYLDNGTVTGVHINFHEIRAGLRYMIDN